MSDALPPLPFRWEGEAMVPLNAHWAKRADKAYAIGETYILVPHEERSSNTHRHYFAAIREIWQSFPDDLSAQLPTPEHARKRALIMTGFHHRHDVVCGSKAEAVRLAAVVPSLDVYAVAMIEGNVVKILTARSQDYRSMDRATFAASKTAVLDYLSDLVGITRADAERHARAA